MGESSKFIHRIGIELEGGWKQARLVKEVVWDPVNRVYKFPLIEDQSLQLSEFSPTLGAHVGEWVSPPLFPEEAISWMHDHYPDAMTPRCGLHVHTSFRKTEHYRTLVDKDFFDLFRRRMKEWGLKRGVEIVGQEFFDRLGGKNKYCVAKFIPEVQMHLKNKAPILEGGQNVYPRRSMLNYCWEMHRTIECRLFPMWQDPTTAEGAIRVLLALYDEWLTEHYRGDYARSVTLNRVGRKQTIERRGN